MKTKQLSSMISRIFGRKENEGIKAVESQASVKELSAEDRLLRAVQYGKIEEAARLIPEVKDINVIVEFDDVMSIDNGLDYVQVKASSRFLDAALANKDEAMAKLLRAFGARSSEEFEAEEYEAKKAREKAENERRMAQVEAILKEQRLA